jgi:hypothetical protein
MSCFGRSRGAIQRPKGQIILFRQLNGAANLILQGEGTINVRNGISIEYLVVGGGGGAGITKGSPSLSGWVGRGGGGGAGGFLAGTTTMVRGTHSITVGAGGTISTVNGQNGADGGNSLIQFSNGTNISAIGGGGGGFGDSTNTVGFLPVAGNGSQGGSGGGGGGAASLNTTGPSSLGGARISGQGNSGAGGSYKTGTNVTCDGGGGGGAGTTSATTTGTGGSGATSSIDGTVRTYSAGGFGRLSPTSDPAPNTGSGGHVISAASPGVTGRGGSGIVIIRYADVQLCTGGAISTVVSGGVSYTVHKFTSGGTLTF